MTIARIKLPNRRPAHTETLVVDGQAFTATVGFDPESGKPHEVFMSAGKEGSMLNALLADVAVAISVALQHGVSARALAKSVDRLPACDAGLLDLDHPPKEKVPASPIGAALDLVASFEMADRNALAKEVMPDIEKQRRTREEAK